MYTWIQVVRWFDRLFEGEYSAVAFRFTHRAGFIQPCLFVWTSPRVIEHDIHGERMDMSPILPTVQ